jgi:transcriptional regulator with XRE-family HTH domain
MATRKPGIGPQLRTIEEVHERLGLSYGEIAESLGTDEGMLERWRQGDPAPLAVFKRLDELRAFTTELDRTFGSPADGRAWLDRSLAALGHRAPRALIRAGEVDLLTSMLYALNAGIPT